jgi:hypothetical protein
MIAKLIQTGKLTEARELIRAEMFNMAKYVIEQTREPIMLHRLAQKKGQ